MCDLGDCGVDKGQQSGPPENLPSWFKCGGGSSSYPTPAGAEILPITVGGRNGAPPKKNKFKCGEKPKNVKPKICADCPMAKSRAQVGCCDGGKGPGIIARIKQMLGLK